LLLILTIEELQAFIVLSIGLKFSNISIAFLSSLLPMALSICTEFDLATLGSEVLPDTRVVILFENCFEELFVLFGFDFLGVAQP
jgi:hypothetical protein